MHSRPITAYKYSRRFKIDLHEAVILNGQPIFLTYDRRDNSIKIVRSIKESNHAIRPPTAEEYPYEPYEFKDMSEVLSYAHRAKNESIDYLYSKGKLIE